MAKRSFKVAPATVEPGARLKQPDFWVLLETTGGKVKEIDRYRTYPEAIRANREVCEHLPR